MRRIGVVVPAGGTGTRIGRRVPKQFLRLGNTPILLVTLRHFVRHPEVAGVVVPAPPAYLDRTRRLVARAATRVCEVRVVPERGREVVAGPGTLLGLEESLAARPRWYDAVARSEASAVGLDVPALLDILEDEPQAMIATLTRAARYLVRRG